MTRVLVPLQGYLVGNRVTSEKRFDPGLIIPYSQGMGIISDELYEVNHSDLICDLD